VLFENEIKVSFVEENKKRKGTKKELIT